MKKTWKIKIKKQNKIKIQKKAFTVSTSGIELPDNTGINNISGGKPFGKNERSIFENKIGSDFSDVKIHTGDKAESMAKSINAKAFTKGNDIVFAKDQYQHGTNEGKKLLANELVHTVQQKGLEVRRQGNDKNKDNKKLSKSDVLNVIILYLDDIKWDPIERNDVESVLKAAVKVSNECTNYRKEYFQLTEVEEAKEKEAIKDFVKYIYSDYWNNSEYFTILKATRLKDLYDKLKLIYKIH